MKQHDANVCVYMCVYVCVYDCVYDCVCAGQMGERDVRKGAVGDQGNVGGLCTLAAYVLVCVFVCVCDVRE